MKNLFFVFLLFICVNHSAYAQSDSPAPFSNYNLYLDAGMIPQLVGSISINAERKILSTKPAAFTLYARAGFGYMYSNPPHGSEVNALGGPVGLTFLFNEGYHHFEIFHGALIGRFKYGNNNFLEPDEQSEDGFEAFPLFELGYRYQKPGGGFLFRAKAGIQGLGISLGHAF